MILQITKSKIEKKKEKKKLYALLKGEGFPWVDDEVTAKIINHRPMNRNNTESQELVQTSFAKNLTGAKVKSVKKKWKKRRKRKKERWLFRQR